MAFGSTSQPGTNGSDSSTDYTLGERICKARDAVGLSTAQLARRLGIKTSTLQGWESDRSEPRSNKLVLLAGILNVSPTWLLVGRGAAPLHEDDDAASLENVRIALDRIQNQALSLVEGIERLKHRIDGDVS